MATPKTAPSTLGFTNPPRKMRIAFLVVPTKLNDTVAGPNQDPNKRESSHQLLVVCIVSENYFYQLLASLYHIFHQ